MFSSIAQIFKQQNGQQTNSNFKNADIQKPTTFDFDKKLNTDFGMNLVNNYTNLSLRQIMNGQGTAFLSKDLINLGKTSIRLDDKETYRKMLNNSSSCQNNKSNLNQQNKQLIHDFTKSLLTQNATKKRDFSFLLKKNDNLIKSNWYNASGLENKPNTHQLSSFYKPFSHLTNAQLPYGKRVSLLENLKKIDEQERTNFHSDCIDLENDLNNVVQRTLVENKQFVMEYDDNHFGNISKGTSSLCISEPWEDVQEEDMEVDDPTQQPKLSAPVDIHDKNFADKIAKRLEQVDIEQNRILKEKENKYKEVEENTRLTIQELEKISKERMLKGTNVSKLKYYPPCYDVEQQDELSDIEYPPEDEELSDLEDLKDEEEEIKLTKEIVTEVDKVLSIRNMDQLITNQYNCEIRRKDIETLQGLNWLNDEVINFYFNMLMERNPKKIYCFNTFFYGKLKDSGHRMLKRWTKKVDIFSFNLILIPIHLGMHWTLASIDMLNKEINYYDSMNGNNQECVKLLLIYLRDELEDKKKEVLDTENWKTTIVKGIPQQMNGSDCGMFTCKYADYLSRGKSFTFNQVRDF